MVYVIATLLAALDQWIKWQIVTHFVQGQSVRVWPGVLELLYARNPGAAWSMLTNQRAFLIAVAVLVCAAIVFVDRKFGRQKPMLKIALGLLMGGAAGNLIDRIVRGYVVDYVYVQLIHFPVFNLADSAVVVGVAMLVVRAWIVRGDDKPDGAPGADDQAGQGGPGHDRDPN